MFFIYPETVVSVSKPIQSSHQQIADFTYFNKIIFTLTHPTAEKIFLRYPCTPFLESLEKHDRFVMLYVRLPHFNF